MPRVHFSSTGTTTVPQTSSSTLILTAQNALPCKRLSASCQQIITEDISAISAHLIVRSCLADSELYPIIEGHKCNNVPLVSSALGADMAMVCAKHLWSSVHGELEGVGLNVCDFEWPKPYIAQIPQRNPGQYIECDATATFSLSKPSQLEYAKCEIRSTHPDGTPIATHAYCTVRFESTAHWKAEWAKYSHLIKTQIKDLHRRTQTGEACRMQRGLAYKVFKSFVTYGETYQGMSEVVFDGLEGTSTVEFQTTASDYCPPYHYDNSCHVSGFLCNASDLESDANVFISEGWNGFKCIDSALFSMPSGTLTNYVLMQPKEKGIVQGDVYVLREGEIVALWEGIKFKKVPRRIINLVLPPPKKT